MNKYVHSIQYIQYFQSFWKCNKLPTETAFQQLKKVNITKLHINNLRIFAINL